MIRTTENGKCPTCGEEMGIGIGPGGEAIAHPSFPTHRCRCGYVWEHRASDPPRTWVLHFCEDQECPRYRQPFDGRGRDHTPYCTGTPPAEAARAAKSRARAKDAGAKWICLECAAKPCTSGAIRKPSPGRCGLKAERVPKWEAI